MQKAYWNFKENLNSNTMNTVLLGILEPGRYRGFDTMIPLGLTCTLSHNLTGIEQTKEDLSSSNKTGIILTKQGYVIQEDEDIPGLVVQTNAANAFIRRDLIVCEHQDVNTIGGAAAVYVVIRGTNGVTTPPNPTNPTYQTPIGIITIPASASDLYTSTWQAIPCPLPGGHTLDGGNFPETLDFARRSNEANIFSKLQTLKLGEVLSGVVDDITGIVLCPDGNNFEINMKENTSITDFKIATGTLAFPIGSVIGIKIKSTTGAGNMTVALTALSNIADIKETPSDNTISLKVNDTLTLLKSSTKWVILTMNGEVMRRLVTAESNITANANAIGLFNDPWISVNPSDIVLKGYAGNTENVSTISMSGSISVGELNGTSAFFKYKLNGKTARVMGALQISYTYGDVDNLRLFLPTTPLIPVDISSIKDSTFSVYRLEHGSASQIPSGIFPMIAKGNYLKMICDNGIATRSSQASFGDTYSITGIASPVLDVLSTNGSGTISYVIQFNLTYEIN